MLETHRNELFFKASSKHKFNDFAKNLYFSQFFFSLNQFFQFKIFIWIFYFKNSIEIWNRLNKFWSLKRLKSQEKLTKTKRKRVSPISMFWTFDSRLKVTIAIFLDYRRFLKKSINSISRDRTSFSWLNFLILLNFSNWNLNRFCPQITLNTSLGQLLPQKLPPKL